MGLVKLTISDSRNKVSPLASVFLSFFPGGGGGGGRVFFGTGGGRLSLFQLHLLIFLGHPFVFIPRAFINPMWTLVHLFDLTKAQTQP